MPTPKKGPRIGRDPAHQRLIMANLAASLFAAEAIVTTEAKAKALRPYAEKLITKAKRAHLGENPLHNRREVLKSITDKGVVHHLFTEIAPAYAERPGGYTRITKIGPRQGDNAPMAVIELVTEAYNPKQSAPKKTEEPQAAPVVEEEPAVEEPTAEVEETEEAPAEAEATDEAAADEPAADVAEEAAADEAPAEESDEQA